LRLGAGGGWPCAKETADGRSNDQEFAAQRGPRPRERTGRAACRAIFDSELRDLINRAPTGVEFIFVSDSCHSGKLTRRLGSRPRAYIPPADIEWRLLTAKAQGIVPKLLEVHDRCGLISGCREDQESADAFFDGRFNGALTYFLLESLEAGEGALPLSTLVPNVRSRLSQAAYDQEPQLHGPDEITGRGFLLQ
jgi:hypothetical protein